MPYRTDESFRDGSCSDRDVSPGRLSDLHRPSGLSGAGSDNNGLGIRTTMSSDIGRIPTITEPMVERRTTAGTHHHEDEAKDEPTAGRPRVRHLFTIAMRLIKNSMSPITRIKRHMRSRRFPANLCVIQHSDGSASNTPSSVRKDQEQGVTMRPALLQILVWRAVQHHQHTHPRDQIQVRHGNLPSAKIPSKYLHLSTFIAGQRVIESNAIC
jgi:hypothetical protein